MLGQTAVLLAVALFALIGSLPRLLEKEVVPEAECPGPGRGPGPCLLPFLSENPMTLRCPGALEAEEGLVHWQYLNLSGGPGPGPGPGLDPDPDPDPRPRTFLGPRGARAQRGPLSGLAARALLRGGALVLGRARPADSGLYLCRAGAATLGAYRVEVQDAGLLHVSHRGLGQAALAEQSLRLAGGARLRLHTRWGPWQECDRCGAPGERKRLGFCWASLREAEADQDPEAQAQAQAPPSGPDLPCGLMQRRLAQALPRRGPEIRYESCRRECGGAWGGGGAGEQLSAQAQELLGPAPSSSPLWAWPPTPPPPRAAPTLLLDTLLLDVHEEAHLRCPGASVYTPVSWQRDSTHLTRLDLLPRPHPRGPAPAGPAHRLDQATGGSVYHIAGVRRADQGVYRCWVSGRRAAAFHLELPEPPPQRRRHHSRRLLGILRAVLGSFALVFVVSALAELLHSCWCEVM